MRVCFISHTAGRGGAELALLELVQGLIAEGVDCKVLVPKRGPLLEALDRLHVEWKIISYPWMVSVRPRRIPDRTLRAIKAALPSVPMARAITRWRCDVVLSNTATIGAGALAALLARLPHVWHLHEFGYHDHNLLFHLGERRAVQLIGCLSAVVIANSKAVAKEYACYISPNKIRVIYQSVTPRDEIEKIFDVTPGPGVLRCIMVGTLQSKKGHTDAIKALSEVIRRGISAHLLVVGEGDERFAAELLEQVKDLGLERWVTFHGYVSNPLLLIRSADLMLMCSRWEAFGRVTVEAMLAGKALIGSASGGTIELIQDGKTGLLYESGNHAELADKIQYLHDNPEDRKRLGTAARSWAIGRFTQERYAKEVLDLLNEVLAKEKITGL